MGDETNSGEQRPRKTGVADGYILWFAQGFGLGRIPFAPGTFGALGGLLWFALLMSASIPAVYVAGLVVGVAVSVALGGVAERILGVKDPSSFVLDEIAAMPFCFAAWLGITSADAGRFCGLECFFGWEGWWKTVGIFVGFRLFDVVKPWPIGWSQRLPGGWGVTVDDVLAAGYVNGVVLVIYWFSR